MSNGEFTCAHCHGIFQMARSDEEALAEKDDLFPDVPLEDCAVVCEDCFGLLTGNVKETDLN